MTVFFFIALVLALSLYFLVREMGKARDEARIRESLRKRYKDQ